ncbi:cupin domain-containing protein [Paraburkholderia solisilvae]|uniref:5-nitrosalicylic acid 1,2-dioxygenase n=1 Tax=Paraburkholderia solisilvae TaxID=624376 RepID=A0A6J5EC86_9BURK|nr:cupin domain-containing protein [Paraburkholderia solisilvae]CAB3764220.1 5-nitrosalicylic acid 1,2-dioxygenase [Paraburkholderia solisilvae]
MSAIHERNQHPAAKSKSAVTHDGGLIPFAHYLSIASRTPPRPAHWSAKAIADATGRFPHGERGTAALVPCEEGFGDPGSVEAAPGISLTLQIVEPQQGTRPHRHAFWHLYLVVAGDGVGHVASEGDRHDAAAYSLVAGDVLYVPAWATHSFVNPDSTTPLMLYALQNLPQLAALGTLVREAPDGGIEHVYRVSSGEFHSL